MQKFLIPGRVINAHPAVGMVEVCLASEADARIVKLENAMRKAIESMNDGAYGMAAVTLSAELYPASGSL